MTRRGCSTKELLANTVSHGAVFFLVDDDRLRDFSDGPPITGTGKDPSASASVASPNRDPNSDINNMYEGRWYILDRGDDQRKFYLVLDHMLREVDERTWRGLVGESPSTLPTRIPDLHFFHNKIMGQPIIREFPLIRGLEGRVYLNDNGKKRWIVSGEILALYGFSWSTIKDLGAKAEEMENGPDMRG